MKSFFWNFWLSSTLLLSGCTTILPETHHLPEALLIESPLMMAVAGEVLKEGFVLEPGYQVQSEARYRSQRIQPSLGAEGARALVWEEPGMTPEEILRAGEQLWEQVQSEASSDGARVYQLWRDKMEALEENYLQTLRQCSMREVISAQPQHESLRGYDLEVRLFNEQTAEELTQELKEKGGVFLVPEFWLTDLRSVLGDSEDIRIVALNEGGVPTSQGITHILEENLGMLDQILGCSP